MWLSDLFVALARRFGAKPSQPGGAVGQLPPIPPSLPPAAGPVAPEQPACPMTPAEFIAAIVPAAQACMRATRVPASVTVAQAALESAWGAHAPGHNLFGIKADTGWSGPVTLQETHEVVDGRTIEMVARFRAYPDWQGSIDDHAAFLAGNPRYKFAFADPRGPEFAEAIARAGYATDPVYAAKLKAVMTAHKLCALDLPEIQP
jgi:flagellar protein FlgJ